MKIKRLDHLTLTVSDLARSTRFYHEVFDMPILEETPTTTTLRCGHQLLRLQTTTANVTLQATKPTIGGADLCLVTGDTLADDINHLKSYFVEIIAGPLTTTGANGEMTSIYVNDPDGNLIAISEY